MDRLGSPETALIKIFPTEESPAEFLEIKTEVMIVPDNHQDEPVKVESFTVPEIQQDILEKEMMIQSMNA